MMITPTLIGVIASGNRSRNDPYFPDCIVLMHYDNNYTDVKGNSFSNSGTTFSTTAKWGSHSMSVNGTSPGGGGSNGLTASGTALDFTSSGDFTCEAYVYLNNNVATGYCALLRLAGASGTEVTFGMRAGGGGPNCLFASTLIGFGNLADSISATNIPTGQFVHIAFVRSGNNFYLFADGVQATTWTRTYYPASGSKTLQVGHVGAFAMDGRIDDLRITKFARYTSNFTPPTAAFPDS